jgi:hypothetical protein
MLCITSPSSRYPVICRGFAKVFLKNVSSLVFQHCHLERLEYYIVVHPVVPVPCYNAGFCNSRTLWNARQSVPKGRVSHVD